MSSPKLQSIRRYFSLLSTFNSDPKEYETILHSDMVETEYPNLLSPETRERNNKEGLQGIALGKEILKFQKFDIQKVFESEEAVIVEVIWSGEVGVNIGPLKQDQAPKAYICYVFEFKDGLIVGIMISFARPLLSSQQCATKNAVRNWPFLGSATGLRFRQSASTSLVATRTSLAVRAATTT